MFKSSGAWAVLFAGKAERERERESLMIIIDMLVLSLAHGLWLGLAIFGDGHPFNLVPLLPGAVRWVGTYLL